VLGITLQHLQFTLAYPWNWQSRTQ